MANRVKGSTCVTTPNVVAIGQTVTEKSRFLANMNLSSRSLFAVTRPSVCLPVCNVREP